MQGESSALISYPRGSDLSVLLSGLAQFVPQEIRNSNNGVNAEKIIAGKDAT